MTELRRELGFKTMVFLTINALIGTDIFFLSSVGANYAGPASLVSWVLVGFLSILISFIFAELVGMYPKAGGVYEFAKGTFKEFPSFLTGWITWLVANITISLYVGGAITHILPAETILNKIVISFAIILALNAISYRGINTSKIILLIFSLIAVILPISITILGLPHIQFSNFFPFFVLPIQNIFIFMFLVSEAFTGWESVTSLSEETKEPEKIVPKSLVAASTIIFVICVSFIFVFLGVMNWKVFVDPEASVSLFFDRIFGSSVIFNYLIFAASLGAAASWIVSTPRLVLGMARNNMFLKNCEKIHWKYKTPYIAIIFQTIVSLFVLIIGLSNYMSLVYLSMPLSIILYIIVLFIFIRLRFTENKKRPFVSPIGVPGAFLIALLFIVLFIFWLMVDPKSIHNFIICLFLIFLGTPIYIIIRLQDRKFVEFLFDHICQLYNILIHIWYGKREREKVIGGLKIKENYNILDYGCGAAVTNLLKLSEDLKEGNIVAVDVSKKQLEHCVAKVKKMSRRNIILVKEEKEMVKFKKNTFDGILSVGVVYYQKDPLRLFKEFRKILKKNRRISILEFGKTLIFSPPPYLKDKSTVRELLKAAGFRNIKIEKKIKLLTTYYFITAEK